MEMHSGDNSIGVADRQAARAIKPGSKDKGIRRADARRECLQCQEGETVATTQHATAAGAAEEALKAIAEATETTSAKAAAEPTKAAPAKTALTATKAAIPLATHAASSSPACSPAHSPSESLKAKDELPTNTNDGTLALSVANSLVVVGLVAASFCSSKNW